MKAYLEFGEALEKYHDYIRAEKLYARLLTRQQKEFAKSAASWGDANLFEEGGQCIEKFATNDSTADFLKAAHQGKFSFNQELLMRYGRTLVRQGKNAEALRPLCFASDILGNNEAQNLKVLALFHTGNGDEVTGGPYDLDGADLGKLDVTGKDLSGWSFANSSVTFLCENTIFDGANFSGSKLSGKISNSSFKGANLGGAKIGAQIDNVDFTNADLSKAKINGRSLTNIKFTNSNLSEARIYADTANDIDFTNANMSKINISEYFGGKSGQNIILRDANLEGAVLGGIKLENVDFGTANLKNADFSTRKPFGQKHVTTFYGSNLSRTKSIETANFDGAVFNCKTIFPQSFPAKSFLMEAGGEGCPELPEGELPISFTKDYKKNLRSMSALPAELKISRNSFDRSVPRANHSHLGRTGGTCPEQDFLNPELYNIFIPNLHATDLSNLDASGAWLPHADLSDANLTASDFGAANFMGANFRGAQLIGASLSDSLLDKADFAGANLANTDLRFARMTDTLLDNANLAGAFYDQYTIWPQGFDPVKAGAIRSSPLFQPGGPPNDKFDSKKFIKYRLQNIPEDAELHGVGLHGDGVVLSKGEHDVYVVVRSKKPLILSLNSYNTIKWHVFALPGTKISVLILSGVKAQDVGEIPQGVDVYNFSIADKGRPAMQFWGSDECGGNYDSLDSVMLALTGRNFKSFKGVHNIVEDPKQGRVDYYESTNFYLVGDFPKEPFPPEIQDFDEASVARKIKDLERRE